MAESMLRSVVTLGLGLAASFFGCQAIDGLPGRASFGAAWFRETLAVPSEWVVGLLLLYLVMVLWHIYLRSAESKAAAKAWSDAPGSGVTPLLIVWNYGLMVLSMAMLVGCLQSAARIAEDGAGSPLVSLLCDGTTMWTASSPDHGLLWQLTFMWSKFPELFDTVLLVLRGRPVIFLHWYHHITVLLFCWAVVRTQFPGIIFSFMNAFVHSIMYYYYARMAQGVRPVFGKMLTSIQMLQMVVGVACAFGFVYLNATLPDGECEGSEVMGADNGTLRKYMILSTAVMYGSYFALFAAFFGVKYAAKPAAKPAANSKKAQ